MPRAKYVQRKVYGRTKIRNSIDEHSTAVDNDSVRHRSLWTTGGGLGLGLGGQELEKWVGGAPGRDDTLTQGQGSSVHLTRGFLFIVESSI